MSALDPAWADHWAEAKHADMLDLARRLGARLKKTAAYHWTGPCPLGCASKDGFVVSQKKGFLCRPSGAHGDAVDMVMHIRGGTRKEALAYVTGKPLPDEDDTQPQRPTPTPRPSPARPARKEDAKPATTTAQAITLFRQGVDPRGTLAERYLNEVRKLDLGRRSLRRRAALASGRRRDARPLPQHPDRRAAGGPAHVPRPGRPQDRTQIHRPSPAARR